MAESAVITRDHTGNQAVEKPEIDIKAPETVPEDIRRAMAADYIRRLTGDENTPVTFQVFDDTPDKNPSKARIVHGTVNQHFELLDTLNANGCGVYCTVNATDLKGRGMSNIVGIRAVLADDDDGVNNISDFPLPPHLTVRSSVAGDVEKKQFYWMTQNGDFSQYDGVIEQLVQKYKVCPGGSKGLNRVLRVPGFYHKKNPNDPQLVKVIKMTEDLPYSWEQITRAFPPISNGSGSKNKLQEAFSDDPILKHLRDNGHVKRELPDGKIHIHCPFEASHTTPSAESSTTYFVAYTGGYKHGHFKCQHGHCEGRTREEFLNAIDYRETPMTDNTKGQGATVPTREQLRVSWDDMQSAQIHPPCIVKNYLYVDVGVLTAPGGTGKTTLSLYEIIHIALGKKLYGLEVETPGWVLFITAEDSKSILSARLREVMGGMELPTEEQMAVLDNLGVWDVRGEAAKLIRLRDGRIEPTDWVDRIIETHRDDPPILIIIDPTVNFGVSEGMVNDNEQGLVTAGRRLVRGLGCCVRYITHTGQQNARESALDQYASRGGTALPDGGRMSAVLQPWKPVTKNKLTPPQGCKYDNNSSITVMARPKLSYAPPNLPLIWIKRTGWKFEYFIDIQVPPKDRERAELSQIERYVTSQVKAGNFPSKKSIEADQALKESGLSRNRIRDLISILQSQNRIINTELPKGKQAGNKKTFLTTFDVAGLKAPTGEIG